MEKDKIGERKWLHACILGMARVREARGTAGAGALMGQELPPRLSRGCCLPAYFHKDPLPLMVLT